MLSVKVIDVVPLSDIKLLVFFEDGKIKKFDVKTIIKDYPEYEELQNPDIFNLVQVEAGGYGISWTSDLDCSEGEFLIDDSQKSSFKVLGDALLVAFCMVKLL